MLPPGETNIGSQRTRSLKTSEILDAIAPKESPDSVKIPVALELGPLAREVVGVDEDRNGRPAAIVELALRFYLRDVATPRFTRPFPQTLAAARKGDSDGVAELKLEIDNQVWGSFEQEAASQGVSAEQLAVHAVFYLTTDIECRAGDRTDPRKPGVRRNRFVERFLGVASQAAGWATIGSAPRLTRLACSALRPRWWRPWTELSVLSRVPAISTGERPTMWRRTSTSR